MSKRSTEAEQEEEEIREEDTKLETPLRRAAVALENLFAPSMANARRFERDIGRLKRAIDEHQGDWKGVPDILNNLERTVAAIGELPVAAIRHELRSIADHILSEPAPKDIVDCSVFAPPMVSAKCAFTIQVLLHSENQLMQAAKIAAEFDDGANRRAFAMLKADITRGTVVDLFLDCPSLAIEAPLASVTWRGEPVRASFSVFVSGHHSAETIEADLHLAVAGIPIGEIAFKVSVVQTLPISLTATPPLVPGGDRAIGYKNAFISYSRKDFDRVSFFAQGLAESGAKACVDVTELEPGDEWADELPHLIKQADVVYVMWSDNAAKSDWVVKETRHAVDLHNAGPAKRPRIKPIPLHQPWPAPPEHLKRFHFYSAWQAHRASQSLGLLHDTKE